MGTIKTRRWCDPREPDDGFRLLICELHAAFYGKNGQESITWSEYERRYLEEMKEQAEEIDFLAELVQGGKTLTLLCSSACEDEAHCHRTLLRRLIEERLVARVAS